MSFSASSVRGKLKFDDPCHLNVMTIHAQGEAVANLAPRAPNIESPARPCQVKPWGADFCKATCRTTRQIVDIMTKTDCIGH